MIAKEIGTTKFIEMQEEIGQKELLNENKLPIDMKPGKTEFEKLGFKFGNKIDSNFIEASLPDCWEKRATQHRLWCEIIDENKDVRVLVFFKAACYDRHAHMYIRD